MIYLLSIILILLPTYLVRFSVFGLPATFLELLIAVFLLGALVQIKKTSFQKIKNLGRLNLLVGLFVLAGIISTIISPEKARALGQLKAFIIEPVLLFYAIVLFFKSEDLRLPLKSLFWSAVAISLFGLVQYPTFLWLPLRFWGTGSEVQRITSVFDYPNALALYLAPLFGLFFALNLKNYPLNKHKWLTNAGLAIMALALILTFSRGAWLAVILTLGVLLARQVGFKKLAWPALAAILILLAIPTVRQRAALGLHDPSSNAHGNLMRVGINKILLSPIVGNGLYGFRTTLAQARFPGEILNYPHNVFLNFWLELGLLGLISFCGICILVFEQHKKTPGPLTLAAGVFLVILLIHGLVDAPYFKNDLSVLFWFVVALAFI